VLVPAGHTQEGRAKPQRVAANLAAKGFIALTYDPIAKASASSIICRNWGAR